MDLRARGFVPSTSFPDGDTPAANGHGLCVKHHQQKTARTAALADPHADGSATWGHRLGTAHHDPAKAELDLPCAPPFSAWRSRAADFALARQDGDVLPLRVSIAGCVAGLLVALVGFWVFASSSASVSVALLLLTIGWFDAIAFGALAVVTVVQGRGRSD